MPCHARWDEQVTGEMMRARTKSLAVALAGPFLAASLVGCGPPAPKSPAPPDPVIFKQPKRKVKKRPKKKRDAEHHAALSKMLESRFGTRSDKDHQARFPLPDRKGWTRVRFSMIKHFTGFIYGKDEHSMTLAVVVELDKDDPKTSAACVQRFEETARTQVSELGGRLGDITTLMRKWQGKPLIVRTGSGEIDILFKHYDAALAWTGYPAYEGACMIYAVVIPYREDRDLAFQLREQWVDAFKKFKPLTEAVPFRHK